MELWRTLGTKIIYFVSSVMQNLNPINLGRLMKQNIYLSCPSSIRCYSTLSLVSTEVGISFTGILSYQPLQPTQPRMLCGVKK